MRHVIFYEEGEHRPPPKRDYFSSSRKSGLPSPTPRAFPSRYCAPIESRRLARERQPAINRGYGLRTCSIVSAELLQRRNHLRQPEGEYPAFVSGRVFF